jgi:hypothetical protein
MARLVLAAQPVLLQLHHTKLVMARFMRAIHFVFREKKLGGPDKPGHDDLGSDRGDWLRTRRKLGNTDNLALQRHAVKAM